MNLAARGFNLFADTIPYKEIPYFA
jgi:hypothetical protein